MEKPQPWGYVSLHNYGVPSAPVTESAQKGLKRFWHKLWHRGPESGGPPHDIEQRASIVFFDELFTTPDWEFAAPVLQQQVDEELAAGRTMQVFVGGPHRCTSDMLRHLAVRKHWTLLEAPSPEHILRGDLQLPDPDPEAVWVIPQLAHWFLRHHDGLEMLRGLLDVLHTTRQPVVMACHSWAWSYLEKAIQIGAGPPEPQVLVPLDQETLEKWFQTLFGGGKNGKTVFREASTGKTVLEVGGPAADNEPANGDSSNLFAHIAARSRGIPEIAWSLWRESILRFDDAMVTSEALKIAGKSDGRTIWVPCWSQLNLPEVPPKPGSLTLFLLHSLLLHAGLPADILPQLLPYSRVEILGALRQLEARCVVESEMDRWRVAAAAYPSVRAALNAENFLLDSL